MEYIFGTSTRDGMTVENLKTVGEQHTNLSGFCTTVRKFQDGSEATDRFRVLEHYHGAESGDKMYDWYIIDSHTRSMKGAHNRAATAAVRLAMMQAQALPDAQALEVPELYPEWEANHAYQVGYIISYGTNSAGDPQLYKVVQAHTSQDNWRPGAGTESLYDAFGLDDGGYPIWSQPSGAHDAYNTGDIVNYNGTLYKSVIDGNVWAPDAYPQGWEVVET